MLKKEEMLYTLADVTIIPATSSVIDSRSECDPFTEGLGKIGEKSKFYPIITSPMSSVVDDVNYKEFEKNKISCIIPRNIKLERRLELCEEVFCAFGLKEIEECFINNIRKFKDKIYVLIDIANGHMNSVIDLGKRLKTIYGKESIVLMGGNIANPKTYRLYVEAGFDYVRVGIAGGSQCLTGTHTGVYYPMASLISDIVETIPLTERSFRKTKIIADGGINSYSDVIKCLALGADYVMLGKIFAKSWEACSPIYYYSETKSKILVDKNIESFYKGRDYYRHYFGMSTKEAQKEIKKDSKLKTSEGRSEEVKVEYSLSGWVENMDSYLRSSMSYTSSFNLVSFRLQENCRLISTTSSKNVNDK